MQWLFKERDCGKLGGKDVLIVVNGRHVMTIEIITSLLMLIRSVEVVIKGAERGIRRQLIKRGLG